MTDIFISYKTEDRDRVSLIVEALRGERFSVWWDRDLVAGEHFANVIEERLSEARCVVVAWSRHSVRSDWVQDEATRANQGKRLIPVFIEDVKPVPPFGVIYGHRLTNWTGDPEDPEFRALIKSIHSRVGEPQQLCVTRHGKNVRINSISQYRPGDLVRIPRGGFYTCTSRHDRPIWKQMDYDFSIDAFPVTNNLYQAFIDTNPDHEVPYHAWDGYKASCWNKKTRTYPEGRSNYPVVLGKPLAFCAWRSAKDEVNYDLPTVDEWIKACGGDGRIYPWGDVYDEERCSWWGPVFSDDTSVSRYLNGVSPYGCFHMLGLVWEKTKSYVMGGHDGHKWRGCNALRWDSLSTDIEDCDIGFRCVVRWDR